MKNKILYTLSLVLLFCNTHQTIAATNTNQQPATATTQPVQNVVKTSLEITDVWARKSMSAENNNSAVYMKINNRAKEQITIIGVSASRVANNVELHKSFVDEKGVSRMTSIDKIVVPAGSQIELVPGATHIMLFDLKRNLSQGDKFDVTIKIQDKSPIIVEAVVK